VHEGQGCSYRLPNFNSIHTAEVYAICGALPPGNKLPVQLITADKDAALLGNLTPGRALCTCQRLSLTRHHTGMAGIGHRTADGETVGACVAFIALSKSHNF
jgi:hypothetical protein